MHLKLVFTPAGAQGSWPESKESIDEAYLLYGGSGGGDNRGGAG